MNKARGKERSQAAGPRLVGQPAPWRESAAEQACKVREAREASAAREAQASIRDRMVSIGRGQQQAGRQ